VTWASVVLSSKLWYAVGKGLPNFEYTVYETVLEARIAIGEVEGSGYEPFTDKAQALAFVARCRILAATLATPTPSMVPAPGLLPDSVPGQHHIYPEARYDDLQPNLHAYPPSLLLGADPSKRDEYEIYGLNIGSVTELETGMSPVGLSSASVKAMAAGMVDVVAIPGMSAGGTSDSEATIIGAALENLAGTRQLADKGYRIDNQWTQAKRTSLRQVTSIEFLRERTNEVIAARDVVTAYLVRTTRATLREAGFVDSAFIDAWAHGGFVTRIVLRALDDYISLHFHLLIQANNGVPWSYIQPEIDFHVGKLSSPRGLYPTRTQALCAIAIYLRDGAARSWTSATLQNRRNVELYTLANRVGDGGTGTGAGRVSVCSKCLTALHSGSVSACPWRNRTDLIARQAGARALLRLADPTVEE
jgi:hypothetical protein